MKNAYKQKVLDVLRTSLNPTIEESKSDTYMSLTYESLFVSEHIKLRVSEIESFVERLQQNAKENGYPLKPGSPIWDAVMPGMDKLIEKTVGKSNGRYPFVDAE